MHSPPSTLTGPTIPDQGVTGVPTSGQSMLSEGVSGSVTSVIPQGETILEPNSIIDNELCLNSTDDFLQNLVDSDSTAMDQTNLEGAIPIQGESGYTNNTLPVVQTANSVPSSDMNLDQQLIDIHVNSGKPLSTSLPHTTLGNIIIPIFNNDPSAAQATNLVCTFENVTIF